MANGTTHRLTAALVVGSVCAHAEASRLEKTAKPIIGAALAAALTNLPDLLEPATHPGHRQFFHSLAFAGLLGTAGYKAYKWEPSTPSDEAIRFLLMVGIGAYFVHLFLDATTPKSLPILGRL